MPDVTIRPLAAADEAEWRILWTAYLHFYETDVSDAVKRETFRRNLSPEHPDQNALVAEAPDGRLLGLVHFIYHAHNWRLERVCYLQDLFTAEAARGRGVGAALIEAVYAAADAAGAPYVYWTTQEFNATARSLYDQIGELTPFIKYQRRM